MSPNSFLPRGPPPIPRLSPRGRDRHPLSYLGWQSGPQDLERAAINGRDKSDLRATLDSQLYHRLQCGPKARSVKLSQPLKGILSLPTGSQAPEGRDVCP